MSDHLGGPEWLAEYVGVPLATVYQWNSRGTGPRRMQVGKYVRYRQSDVDKWLNDRAVDTGATTTGKSTPTT
jgi:excisionase family DNA binding protein